MLAALISHNEEVPSDEEERLQSPRALKLLHTPPDPHFDSELSEAADCFLVPKDVISIAPLSTCPTRGKLLSLLAIL